MGGAVRRLVLLAAVALVGCAGKVSNDNSDDLKNENTNLKVQQVQLRLERDKAIERAESMGKALDQCYQNKGVK